MNVFIYTAPVGHVFVGRVIIVKPAYDDPTRPRGFTDDEYCIYVRDLTGQVPIGTTAQIIDESMLPTDKSNRNNWKERPGGIEASSTISN